MLLRIILQPLRLPERSPLRGLIPTSIILPARSSRILKLFLTQHRSLTTGLTSLTVNLDANGQATVSPADFFAAVTDDCDMGLGVTINGAPSLNVDCSTSSPFNAVLVSDTDSEGQVSNAIIVTITVRDVIDPVLLGVPPNVTVDCDMIPTAPVVGVDITASDNCSVVGITPNEVTTKSGIPSAAFRL